MNSSFRGTTLIVAALVALPLQAKAFDFKGAFERGVKQIERGIEKAIEQIETKPKAPEPQPQPRTAETTPPAPAPEIAGPQPGAGSSETADRRQLVAETQERLNRLGYDAGPVDGLMGARTRRAIEAFERAQGLVPSGEPNDAVLAALRTARSHAEAPAPAGHAEAAHAGAPAPAAGPSGPPAFETTPEPDYRSILRLYMASNADLLQNDAFAFEHHTVFGIPAGSDQRAAQRACMDLRPKMDNEITRRTVLAEAHAGLARDLADAGSWRKTTVVRITNQRWLEEYDLSDESFPLGRERGGGIPFERPIVVAKTATQQRHGGPVPWICNAGFGVRGLRGIVPDALAIQVRNGGLITRLPMPVATAETYLDRHGRLVDLEYLLEVGPFLHGDPAPARIVAARAVDPDGNVLHEYEPEFFRDLEPRDGPALASGSTGRLPMTHYALGLLSVQQHPDLLEGETLENLAYRQIFTEQRIWGEIDKFMAATGGDPSQPMLLYEWQRLADAEPDTARALLENLFVAERASWQFAEDAGALDPRLSYRQKQAFVFARDGIIEREGRFAARELAPVLKRHILDASALVPSTLYFEMYVPDFEYDRKRAAAVFSDYGESTPLRTPTAVAFASDPAPDPRSSTRYLLPDAMNTRALYGHDGRIIARVKHAQGESTYTSAHEHWREAFSSLSAVQPELLALDRLIAFAPIPLAAAEAERWATESRSHKLIARVLIDVERVDLGTRRSSSIGDRKIPILVAELAGVEIVTRTGEVLAALSPDAFVRSADSIASNEAAAEAEARVRAEQAEAEALAKAQAEQKLAALLAGRTGSVLIRRSDSREIEAVYTTGGSAGVGYEQTVRSRSLDLPAKAKGATTRGMADILRGERGAAVVVHASVFAREIFGLVGDLDLTVSSFPPDEASPARQHDLASLAELVPGDSKYLLLRRRDDKEPMARVLAQNDGSVFYSSALRASSFGTRYLEQVGASLAFELPEQAERVDLRDIPAALRDQSGIAVVVRREGLESIFPRVADLDLVARRFPTEEFSIGIPKDHTKGAEQFAILGISGRLDEAAALAALREAFVPEEIAASDRDAVRAGRGTCEVPDFTAAGGPDEVGSYCLVLQSRNGAVSRVTLRQVVPGDAEEAALTALRERYGRSPFMTEVRHLDRGGRRTVHGWGAPLSVDRPSLGRVDAKTPPTVLEAVVWVAEDVTTIVLQLDDIPTLEEVRATQTPEIKF